MKAQKKIYYSDDTPLEVDIQEVISLFRLWKNGNYSGVGKINSNECTVK